MKILILNWRDVKNPSSGGAEILTHEIAKQWVAWGNSVIQFSSWFKGAKVEEVIDGVKIIRAGNPDARSLTRSIHFQAYKYYKKHLSGKIDVVVDEIHGLPFFTPWYVKEKKVVLICEVAGELWNKSFGPFFGTVGQIVEKFFLRFVYSNNLFLTISNSTRDDLIKNGVRRNLITVLPMGISFPEDFKAGKKDQIPTLIFVGRLSRPKGIEDALYAVKIVAEEFPDVRLWIVGRGSVEYKFELERLCKNLKIEKHITFYGFIPENKKFELMSRAHILLAPSIKEGWGLTVPEAATVGTPSISYNSNGLKDIMKQGSYGIIVKSNTPESISRVVIDLLKDKKTYRKLCLRIKLQEKNIGWEKTAKVAYMSLAR